ncbi:MAG TPA: SDR family oxidoreductase [Nocardioidaceae bacterium]|nr:SDR family oxidoreductase [Nocardioidaceae bacterium]
MRITLIGGHGKVALLTAPLLVEAGHEVVSVFRNPDHTDDVAATGAEPKVADVETMDTDAMTELLSGSDVVVWSAGAGGGNPSRTWAVDRDAAIRSMDAAERAGVPDYVMVSYFGARPDHGVPEGDSFFPYAEAKAAADAHLKRSRLRWTILGPSRLTLEPATGRIEVRRDGLRGGEVSRANVARVIATVVEDRERTAGRMIEFNDGDVPIEEALAR